MVKVMAHCSDGGAVVVVVVRLLWLAMTTSHYFKQGGQPSQTIFEDFGPDLEFFSAPSAFQMSVQRNPRAIRNNHEKEAFCPCRQVGKADPLENFSLG